MILSLPVVPQVVVFSWHTSAYNLKITIHTFHSILVSLNFWRNVTDTRRPSDAALKYRSRDNPPQHEFWWPKLMSTWALSWRNEFRTVNMNNGHDYASANKIYFNDLTYDDPRIIKLAKRSVLSNNLNNFNVFLMLVYLDQHRSYESIILSMKIQH